MALLNREEIFAEWLTALRGDKFQQGHKWLAKAGKYCCLGVVCELLAEIGIVSKQDSWVQDNAYFDSFDSVLPPMASELLKISDEGTFNISILSPELSEKVFKYAINPVNDSAELTDLNDSGVPFSVIADVIEEVEAKEGWIL